MYQVNVDHPLIGQLSEKLGVAEQRHLQIMLEYLGASIPYESIYADMCADERRGSDDASIEELVEMTQSLLEVTGLDLQTVLGIDPISRFPAQHDMIKERLKNV